MNYKDLPDHSRVWVYQSDREFTADEENVIRQKVDQFIAGWASHGQALEAAIEIFHNLFIVVFVNEEQAQASGCSIDSSVHFIKELEQEQDYSLFNRLVVAYKEGEHINCCTLVEFEALLVEGSVTEDSVVFNNLVTTKADFDHKWEVPVKDSWHAQLV